MTFRTGERVRIKNPHSEYTGCRGTIADPPRAAGENLVTLGHQVAIDGENGVTRPFLIGDLEPLQAARVRGHVRRAKRDVEDATHRDSSN